MIMPTADLAPSPAAPAAPPGAPAFRQFPVAWRFALRNQARNRLAWLLLVALVPVWYELMAGIAGHTPLTFRLYATGHVLTVDGGHLTLITAGLNAVTMIVGFAVFAAAGLLIFRARTRTRTRHDRRAASLMCAPGHATRKHAPGLSGKPGGYLIGVPVSAA
jgi:hypothetical protein